MVLVCFILDLRCISPPLLVDLKQSLLQLGNLYAVSPARSLSYALADTIALCYVLKNRISRSDELKIGYSPNGSFSLRDFHHAVNSLPTDAFSPEMDDSRAICCRDLKLSSVLNDRVLYSWESNDAMKKLVVVTSCLPENRDSELKKSLTDAADRCVSVEFVLLEQKSSHLSYVQENMNSFLRFLSDLDNCSFQSCPAEVRSLHGLVKRWIQELSDEKGEPLQARFIFKTNLVGSVSHIFCTLSAATNHIVDGFSPCQACRCHGIPLDYSMGSRKEQPCCPVTFQDLGKCDVIENSLKVGDKTILFMSSFQNCAKLQTFSFPIDFHVIERTNLSSLSEGIMMGTSYIVTPSACQEMEVVPEETDQPDLNTQLFQGLRTALHSMDQGLVCSSNYCTETMSIAVLHCYYILQPSEDGPMLLRRLAGSEEVLPVSNVCRISESSVPSMIEASIRNSVLKLESTDYNPLAHDRGFHQKLNLLVKESLPFGSVPPKFHDEACELNPYLADSSKGTIQPKTETEDMVTGEETSKLNHTTREDKMTACITQEWENLVVTEVPRTYSPARSISKPKSDHPLQADSTCQIDIKTSRILERLEVPRQMKAKSASPTLADIGNTEACFPTKKPLIPFQHNRASEWTVASSQLMKPNFQRLKRKHG